ncbi:MAG: hypothetical protein ACKOAO_10015 [Oxalobacteraceae bacterium]
MSRIVLLRAGFALLPCSLMLAVILLALSASLRSTRLQQDATFISDDLRIARRAAESSLADAEQALRVAVQELPASEQRMPSAEGLRRLCDAPHDPLSRYQMALLWSDGRQAICQLTAQGKGRIPSTHISLQAEFALSDCPLLDPAPPDDHASCQPSIQLLSWRALEEL